MKTPVLMVSPFSACIDIPALAFKMKRVVHIWVMSHIELLVPYTWFRALLQLNIQPINLTNLYLTLHDYLLEEFYPI